MFGLISAGAAMVILAGRYAAGVRHAEQAMQRTGPAAALPRARLLRRRRWRALIGPSAR